jgi:hypothetical protein
MALFYFLFREINVGYASGVMVLAVTNTGEPGYSLYIPSEFALQIYDNFMKVIILDFYFDWERKEEKLYWKILIKVFLILFIPNSLILYVLNTHNS